ncbi:MAG: hypothetical protein II350_07090 [Clostridia bacterium]|nr:hypothetical protein [Clostridia bacterium]
MEYRILGMERKIALGLGYLIWPLALIAVLTGRKEIDREDRVHLWVGVFSAALGVVPIIGYVVSVIAYVFCIISAIKCFTGNFADANVPFLSEIINKRVH